MENQQQILMLLKMEFRIVFLSESSNNNEDLEHWYGNSISEWMTFLPQKLKAVFYKYFTRLTFVAKSWNLVFLKTRTQQNQTLRNLVRI